MTATQHKRESIRKITKIDKPKISPESPPPESPTDTPESSGQQSSSPRPSGPLDIRAQDYREFLHSIDAGAVDLLLTDPPYIISRDTGFAKVKNGVERFAVSMDFGEWDKVAIDLDALASESYRALRKGGTAIIWYDLWKIGDVEQAMKRAGFKMIRLIIWQKTNPVPLNQKATYLSNSREVAVVGVKDGKPTFHGQYHNGIYEYPIPRHGGNKIHPTQKPVDLFAELVRMHSNARDLVVDPFLGSGTTAEAALLEKCRFWGCDIDEYYAKAAQERVGVVSSPQSRIQRISIR